MLADVDTLIIGAGPAGLAIGASLGRLGLPATLVERGSGVGQSWRDHYHRLHLHTVKQHSSLPMRGFPAHHPTYPSRAQVVEYLEDYACHFSLRIEFGVEIQRLAQAGDSWRVTTADQTLDAARVVLACGQNRVPVRPRFPGQEAFGGEVLHAADYRTGTAFAGKRALVVGAGNTGAEIGLDLVEHGAQVSMCIRSPQHVIPRDFLGTSAQSTGIKASRLPLRVRDALATTASRLAFGDLQKYGIRRPSIGPITQIVKHRKVPLIDIGTVDRIKRGDITVRPAIESFTATGVRYTDGNEDPIDVVVLATGYRNGLQDWVEVGEQLLDDSGYPHPTAGRTRFRGLYTIGFENAAGGWLRQIGLDAPRVAAEIAADARAAP